VIFAAIYPAGTLPIGATASNSPDDPGSIGAWTFRSTLTYDGGVSRGSGLEACCGLPALDTPPLWIQMRRGKPVGDVFNQLGMGTAHYQFDNGGTLVVEGPVSRPRGAVAVVGGMGAFRGATGELTGVAIGTNSTGYPNLRITFRLTSPRR
jgi:hypothetical protein